MRRFALGLGLTALLGSLLLLNSSPTPLAAQTPQLQWIWTSDSKGLNAPEGVRYFRKTLTLDRHADEAVIDITADDEFTLWVNGVEVGRGETWNRVYRFTVTKQFAAGKVVLAVAAKNTAAGAAGLLVKLGYTPNGKNNVLVTSDASWKASRAEPAQGWQKADFDDSKWEPAKEVAKFGGGPWQALAWDAGGDERFSVPKGFKVEVVVPPTARIQGFHDSKAKGQPNFSLVNMCFDAKGRLLCSQERGPIILCADPDANGVFQTVRVFCDAIRNAHGMCWIHDHLYVVGDGRDAEGRAVTGLWRGKLAQGKDVIESLELLHRFRGGMGEHGPHAVIHGPDDKLYIVIGNHAGATVEKLADNSPLTRWPTGAQGPDQNQPNTTEDVLLPRQNDARGHAANILAPGGTIWRMDLDGKNPALYSAGYRNQFDAAFNPAGELFSFDSDMEWDENLPWYRAVRVIHATPGSDFVWRTGAANTPNYYADSLPPVVETGRGSPTGVEFYDHHLYGAKYKGCFFMCDWSIGTIWAVTLQRDGATYRGKAERFCSASPMPVSDCVVGPDGCLYFTLGGRNTQGGVYRVVPEGVTAAQRTSQENDQPLAPWSARRSQLGTNPAARAADLAAAANKPDAAPEQVADYLTALANAGNQAAAEPVLIKALTHADALVRRRACEALLQLRIEPPVAALRPLLADPQIYVRTAARLVLQKIDPAKWAKQLLVDSIDRVAHEAIVALCKVHAADRFTAEIFERLHDASPGESPPQLLEWTRVVQLALIHCKERPGAVRGIALDCKALFPHADAAVSRELAILLADFAKRGELTEGVPQALVRAMHDPNASREQAIHYFYCLRVIPGQFDDASKQQLLAWYDNTKGWTGGASFTPFLENILRDANSVFTAADRAKFFEQAEKYPQTAALLLKMSKPDQLPAPARLGQLYASIGGGPRAGEIKEGVLDALARCNKPEAVGVLRELAANDPGQKAAITRALTRFPTAENLPVFLAALPGAPAPLAFELLEALLKTPAKPKPEDAAAFRAVLLASGKLPDTQRWKAVEVLQHWTGGKSFGAGKGDAKREIASWGQWFSQAYPKEAPLPDLAAGPKVQSKYAFEELLALVEKQKGDPAKGRVVYEKAQCAKCHQHGEVGVGIGPDLSTLGKRFKRSETLESIYYPSKVISDQFRSTTVVLLDGKRYDGILAENGNNFSIVLQDATRVNFTRDDIEKRFDSLVSVMPEKLIDELTREEIADLFAFLEVVVPERKK